MRRRRGISLPERYLLILLSVIGTAGLFLFLPVGEQNAQQPEYFYYSYLNGSASDSSLASDMLEPEQVAVQVPDDSPQNARLTYQAEDLIMNANTAVRKRRKDHSGRGYVSVLKGDLENVLQFTVDAPASQHYAVTVCAASDQRVTNEVCINGNYTAPFTLDGSGRFILVTFYGIYMEQGENTVSINSVDGGIDVDYIMLRSDASLSETEFQIAEAPCDPQATPEATALYQTLRSEWGKHILTGQYASGSDNRELQAIHQLTGQLPAIRFSALGTDNDREVLEAAMDWSAYMHGVVGLMWYWNAPGSDSVYFKDANFSLYEAIHLVDPETFAQMSISEIEEAVAAEEYTESTLLLVRDIDETAEKLKKLQNMDIPVLWRPLHEAGGSWYWWGANGSDAYVRLWKLLYYRMTEYHGLHNLIWVWNGQSATYLVPESTYDIASADVYLQPDMEFGSRYEQYLSLAKMSGGKKMLALSECSAPPDTGMMLLDHSVWSFYGTWYGDYLLNEDGTLSERYYSSNDLYNLYNSELALSLNDFLSICQ